jgi:hypothetical protein
VHVGARGDVEDARGEPLDPHLEAERRGVEQAGRGREAERAGVPLAPARVSVRLYDLV